MCGETQHESLKAVGLLPSCILTALIFYHGFSFSEASLRKHTAAALTAETKKKEVKGRCGVEAMKAIRRELLPPVAVAVHAFQK